MQIIKLILRPKPKNKTKKVIIYNNRSSYLFFLLFSNRRLKNITFNRKLYTFSGKLRVKK